MSQPSARRSGKTAAQRESSAKEIERLLNAHTLQYGPAVGQICSCGSVNSVRGRNFEDLRSQQEIHYAHVAWEIAKGLVP